jgi:hypothetical protein
MGACCWLTCVKPRTDRAHEAMLNCDHDNVIATGGQG